MEMRNNIPGLIERLKSVNCSDYDDFLAIGQAMVYLTYLYDILELTEGKQNLESNKTLGFPDR